MTDLGTTSRGRLSRRDRLNAWEDGHGICCICNAKIDGTRERWIVEHVRALELGGEDNRENRRPAHERCAIEKTRGDHAMAAKAKRQKARHIGAYTGKGRPMPGSKASGWRRRMNGTVEKRT